MNKRGSVWLASAGLVRLKSGEWLVVKKKYGGLKGYWSIPAGFVQEGETADEAAIREVLEETGVQCTLKGLAGLRTGVIKGEISDNMLLFLLEPEENPKIAVQETEIEEACFMDPAELVKRMDVSVMLQYLLQLTEKEIKPAIEGVDPGERFGYTAYKLFL